MTSLQLHGGNLACFIKHRLFLIQAQSEILQLNTGKFEEFHNCHFYNYGCIHMKYFFKKSGFRIFSKVFQSFVLVKFVLQLTIKGD